MRAHWEFEEWKRVVGRYKQHNVYRWINERSALPLKSRGLSHWLISPQSMRASTPRTRKKSRQNLINLLQFDLLTLAFYFYNFVVKKLKKNMSEKWAFGSSGKNTNANFECVKNRQKSILRNTTSIFLTFFIVKKNIFYYEVELWTRLELSPFTGNLCSEPLNSERCILGLTIHT